MILIICNDIDASTDIICAWLNDMNKPYMRLCKANPVIAVHMSAAGQLVLYLESGGEIDLAAVTSTFYRNGDIYYKSLSEKPIHDTVRVYAENEWLALKTFIFNRLAATTRLTGNLLHPEVNKLSVLHTARQLGLTVPETLVVSAKNQLPPQAHKNDRFITKSISDALPIWIDDKQYYNYTTILPAFSTITPVFSPSLIQENVAKKYELRIFFLHNRFWSIAIFTQENREAAVDGRMYNYDNMPHCMPYKLPRTVKEKISRLAKIHQLNSGSVDMIYTTDDQYYFLEVNPVGQFGYVSKQGNYNIEKEIATLL